MLNITVEGDRQLVATFQKLPQELRQEVVKTVTILTLKLEAKEKTEHLLGPTGPHTLSRVTGKLFRSVFSKVEDTPSVIVGKVAFAADVPYAAIHEFGGKTEAHDIFPTKKQALHFMMGDKAIFAKVVHHPGSTIPERATLRTSLAEMKDEIVEGLTATVGRVIAPVSGTP